MSKAIIVLEKYSDWLEAYSLLEGNKQIEKVVVLFLENERNDQESVKGSLGHVCYGREVSYFACDSKRLLFEKTEEMLSWLSDSDYFAAPFIRYRDFWKLVRKVSRSIVTVHISEVLPDTFGIVGYRLAFKGNSFKNWITIPLAYFYGAMHKPDLCYFPLYPPIRNPFVKETKKVLVPPLSSSKLSFLTGVFNEEKRPLLISGFGYSLENMVKELGVEKYIATSKNREIIIDGVTYPLNERICAEEVLLSGFVSKIIGYTSSSIAWARLISSDIKIECYEASELDKTYGSLFTKFSVKSLSRVGIKVLEENKAMLN